MINQTDLSAGKCYNIQGVPSAYSPSGVVKSSGGAHHFALITSTGALYTGGDNSNAELGDGTTTDRTIVNITIDSAGNTLPAFKDVGCSGTNDGWITWALSVAGDVYVWGAVGTGIRGDGTLGGTRTRPVKVPFPGGVAIKQVCIGFNALALDVSGNVYTWGASGVGVYTPFVLAQGTSSPSGRSPVQITLPTTGVMIAGGCAQMNYVVGANGHIYGWSYNIEYTGSKKGIDFFGYNPIDLTDSLKKPDGSTFLSDIDTIATNSISTLVITKSNHSLWGWGDNSCGNLGMGPGLNFRFYRPGNATSGPLTPWGWDQGLLEAMVYKPIAIAPGKTNWTQIFGSLAFCFQWWAEDTGDSLYSMGRNKYQVAFLNLTELTAAGGTLGSTYPNNWDRNYIGPVFPFRSSTIIQTTGRICKDSSGAALCSSFPWDGSKAGPVALAGANQIINSTFTTLKGSTTIASGVSGKTYPLWTNTAKPSGAANPIMPVRSWDTVAVSGLTTPGTYTFKYWTEDSNFKVDSTTMTVLVLPSNTISFPSGSRIIVH